MGVCPTETDNELVLTETDDPTDFKDCYFPLGFTFRIHYKELKIMPEETENLPVHASSDAALPDAAPTQDAEPAMVESTEAAPAAEGVADLSSLQGLAGGNSWLMLALALVAVLGGGAAWKFYQKHSEQKHEQAMKKLELEAKAMKVQTTSPPQCQQTHAKLEAQQTKLEAQITELSERLAKTEKKTLALSGSGVDLEELDERVKKLERAKKSSTAKKS